MANLLDRLKNVFKREETTNSGTGSTGAATGSVTNGIRAYQTGVQSTQQNSGFSSEQEFNQQYNYAIQSGLNKQQAYDALRSGTRYQPVNQQQTAQQSQPKLVSYNTGVISTQQNSGFANEQEFQRQYNYAIQSGLNKEQAYAALRNGTRWREQTTGSRLYDNKDNDQTLMERIRSGVADSSLGNALADRRLQRLTQRYGDKVFDDNFLGQFRANYATGKLSQEYALAYSDYMDNPTKENAEYAQAVRDLYERVLSNNQAALDDQGVQAGWLSKDIAGYLPQLWNQTKTSVPYVLPGVIAGAKSGAAAGAATGGVVGEVLTPIPILDGLLGSGAGAIVGGIAGALRNPLTGVGTAVGSGVYSYDTMRGMAFAQLADLGVDEEQAKAAANDEAFISSVIEMGDTAWDYFTMVPGVKDIIGKKGEEAVAKTLASQLKDYLLNIPQEYGEEFSQEIISMANQRRVERGEYDSGITGLLKECLSLAKEMVQGNASEELSQARQAGRGGAIIGAVMGAGRTGVNLVTTKVTQNQVSQNLNKVLEDGALEDVNDKDLTFLKELADNKGTANPEASKAIQREMNRRENVRKAQEAHAEFDKGTVEKLEKITPEQLSTMSDVMVERVRTLAEEHDLDHIIRMAEDEQDRRVDLQAAQERQAENDRLFRQDMATQGPRREVSMRSYLDQIIRQQQEANTRQEQAQETQLRSELERFIPAAQERQDITAEETARENRATAKALMTKFLRKVRTTTTAARQATRDRNAQQARELYSQMEELGFKPQRDIDDYLSVYNTATQEQAQARATESQERVTQLTQMLNGIEDADEQTKAIIQNEIAAERSVAPETTEQPSVEQSPVSEDSAERRLVKQLIQRAGIDDSYIDSLVISRDGDKLIVRNDLSNYGEGLAEAMWEDPSINSTLTVNLSTGEVVDEGLLSEYGDNYVIQIDKSLQEVTDGREEQESGTAGRDGRPEQPVEGSGETGLAGLGGAESQLPAAERGYRPVGVSKETRTTQKSGQLNDRLKGADVGTVVSVTQSDDGSPIEVRDVPYWNVRNGSIEVTSEQNGKSKITLARIDINKFLGIFGKQKPRAIKMYGSTRILQGQELSDYIAANPKFEQVFNVVKDITGNRLLVLTSDNGITILRGIDNAQIAGGFYIDSSVRKSPGGIISDINALPHEFSHHIKYILDSMWSRNGGSLGNEYATTLTGEKFLPDLIKKALEENMLIRGYKRDLNFLDEVMAHTIQGNSTDIIVKPGDNDAISKAVVAEYMAQHPDESLDGKYLIARLSLAPAARKIINSQEFASYVNTFLQKTNSQHSVQDIVDAYNTMLEKNVAGDERANSETGYSIVSASNLDYNDTVLKGYQKRAKYYGYSGELSSNQNSNTESRAYISSDNEDVDVDDGRFNFTDADIPPEQDSVYEPTKEELDSLRNQRRAEKSNRKAHRDFDSDEIDIGFLLAWDNDIESLRELYEENVRNSSDGFFGQEFDLNFNKISVDGSTASVTADEIAKFIPEDKNGRGKVGRYRIYSGLSRIYNKELNEGVDPKFASIEATVVPEYTVEVFDGNRVVSLYTSSSPQEAAKHAAKMIDAYEHGITKASIPETGESLDKIRAELEKVYGNLYFKGSRKDAAEKKPIVWFPGTRATAGNGKYEVHLLTENIPNKYGELVPHYRYVVEYIETPGQDSNSQKIAQGSVKASDPLSPVWFISRAIHEFDIQMGELVNSKEFEQETRRKEWEAKEAERKARREELAKQRSEEQEISLDEALNQIDAEEKEALKKNPGREMPPEDRVFSDREVPPVTNPWEAHRHVDEYAAASDTTEPTAAETRAAKRKKLRKEYGNQTDKVVYGAKRMAKQKFYFEDGYTNLNEVPYDEKRAIDSFRNALTNVAEGRMTMGEFADYYLNLKNDNILKEFYRENVASRMEAVQKANEALKENIDPANQNSYREQSANAMAALETTLRQVNDAARSLRQLASESVKQGSKGKINSKSLKKLIDEYTAWQISPGNVFRALAGFSRDTNSVGYQIQKQIDKATATNQKVIAKAQLEFSKLADMDGYKEFAANESMSKVKVGGREISEQEAVHLIKLIRTLRKTGNRDNTRDSNIKGFARQTKDGEYEFIDIKEIVGDKDQGVELRALEKDLLDDLSDVAKEYLSISDDVLYELGQMNEKVEIEVNGAAPRHYDKGEYIPLGYKRQVEDPGSANANYDPDRINFGFEKDRTRFSGGYVVLKPVSLAVDNYINQSANHIAYSELGRMLEIMNGETRTMKNLTDTAKNSLGDAYGKWMQQYVHDINTFYKKDSQDSLNSLLGKARRKLQTGALMFSVSVPIKQISSYWSAMGVLNPEAVTQAYRIKFIRQKGEGADNLLLRYRSTGNIDPTVSDVLKSDFLQKMMNKSPLLKKMGDAISTMDVRTVDNLYTATILDIKMANPNMDINSTEFHNLVEEKFEEVVLNTQPIYTENARPQYARTQNELVKIMAMFRTQQTQNFNRLITTIGEWQASKGKATEFRNRFEMQNTIKGQALAAMSLSLLTIAADMVLHRLKKYKDDEGDLDMEKIFDRFAINSVEAAAGTAWLGDTLAKWLIDKISGGETQEYQGLSLGPISTVQNVLERIEYFVESPTISNGRYVATYMAQAFGIPLNNAWNLLNSAVVYTMDAAGVNKSEYDDVLKMIDAEKVSANWKSDNANAKVLLNQYLNGQTSKENKTYEMLSAEKGLSALKSAARQAYVDGRMDDQQASSFLEKYIFPTEEEADKSELEELLLQWQMKRDTGIAYDDLGEAYLTRKITRSQAIDYQMEYGGKTQEEAEEYIAKQEFKKQYGVSYNDMKSLYRSGGISKEEAVQWRIMCGSSEQSAQEWADAQDVYMKTGYEYTSNGSTSYMDAYATKEHIGTNTFFEKYGDQFKNPADFGEVFNALNDASSNNYPALYTTYRGQTSELSNKQRGVIYLLNGFIRDGVLTKDLASKIWSEYYGYSTFPTGAYRYVGDMNVVP